MFHPQQSHTAGYKNPIELKGKERERKRRKEKNQTFCRTKWNANAEAQWYENEE